MTDILDNILRRKKYICRACLNEKLGVNSSVVHTCGKYVFTTLPPRDLESRFEADEQNKHNE